MSKKYPGGIIRGTPVVPAGPYQDGAAPGTWTLDQATNYIKQGIWPLAGNFNPNAFIENLFQTWLYTGTGATQTITNGIDLSTYGGLVWIKCRNTAGTSNTVFDTARGATKYLNTNATGAQGTAADTLTGFNSNGFALGADSVFGFGDVNASGRTYASWTFRKQAKFFDVVTYTGNGTQPRTITHNLGSVPGCIIVKRTDSTSDWAVYHRAVDATNPEGYRLELNTTNQRTATSTTWNNQAPTSTEFYIGSATYNASGGTYVAYLFAHNAGGFGLTGSDNVISCGSFTCDGSGNLGTVTLGYEPQWVLVKRTDAAQNWNIFDTMRGMSLTNQQTLNPNLSNAEGTWSSSSYLYPTATGFAGSGNFFGLNAQCVYIAIRRGPMKTPTTGTSIYGTQLQVNTPTYSFPPDLIWATNRTGNASYSNWFVDRLRGSGQVIRSYSTNAETAESYSTFSPDGANNSWGPGWTGGANYEVSGFRRAPGFFDVVCYTGDGTSNKSITHNLGVAPEFLVVKSRSNVENWNVYDEDIASPLSNILFLNNTNGSSNYSNYWGTSAPTSTTFNVGNYSGVNGSGQTYVAYLFASVAGVSKVGSYSGTGATQTISCGFAARFVLIKRTDSTGNWVVWDTSRGMVAGTDPRLELNTTNAETNANWVYTDASGFQIVTTDATVNASGGSYIFLAIA